MSSRHARQQHQRQRAYPYQKRGTRFRHQDLAKVAGGPPTYSRQWGDWLKHQRETHGLCQFHLAEVAHVDASYLSAMECSGLVPSQLMGRRLARALQDQADIPETLTLLEMGYAPLRDDWDEVLKAERGIYHGGIPELVAALRQAVDELGQVETARVVDQLRQECSGPATSFHPNERPFTPTDRGWAAAGCDYWLTDRGWAAAGQGVDRA